MPDWIQQTDTSVFYEINRSLANPVFDFIMPIVTEFRYWLPIYIILFVWLLWKGGRNGRICALLLIVAVILTDQVSATYIKAAVGRIRPCQILNNVHLLVHCGGGKSFPSSHAANNFGAATILTYFYRKKGWIFFSLAALVAFSRVYVGVHYPFDVIAGAILGTAISAILILLFRAFQFWQVKHVESLSR